MSINGLQQAYIPASLDGLSYLDLDGLTIDGQTVDLTTLVPYTGADKVIDAGAQPIRTSNTPTLATDVVNLATLNSATGGTIGYVDQYFVPYNGATSDTNLGNRSLTVGPAGQTSFSGVLKTELNNVLAGYTPASIVVGDGFGAITNSGGVYESTSTGPGSFASLSLGDITPGEKYSVSVSVKCIDPNYTTNIYIYESIIPNLSAGGISLLSFSIPPATSTFTVFSGTFTPTLSKLLLVFNTQIVTGSNTLYWNAFSLTGMGTTVKNLISPAAALDGANKQYVDDEIAITAATLVPYTNAIYPLDLGAQDLYAFTARFTNVTAGAPSLALGLDVSGNLRSFAVPSGTGLLSLNNIWTGTNDFNNAFSAGKGAITASLTAATWNQPYWTAGTGTSTYSYNTGTSQGTAYGNLGVSSFTLNSTGLTIGYGQTYSMTITDMVFSNPASGGVYFEIRQSGTLLYDSSYLTTYTSTTRTFNFAAQANGTSISLVVYDYAGASSQPYFFFGSITLTAVSSRLSTPYVAGSLQIGSITYPTPTALTAYGNVSITGATTLTGTASISGVITATGIATGTPATTLGLNSSNQIVKYTPSWIGGSVSASYVPYASSANVLADSLISQSGFTVNVAGDLECGIINPTTGISRVDNRAMNSKVASGGLNLFVFGSWANNNTAPYSDCIFMNNWTDSTGGNTNILMVRKDTFGIRQYQGTFGSSATMTSYQDCCMKGSGDNTKTIFQPVGGTWNVPLTVGSGTDNGGAQLITTDGNIHLDSSTSHNIYLGYFRNPINIYSYASAGITNYMRYHTQIVDVNGDSAMYLANNNNGSNAYMNLILHSSAGNVNHFLNATARNADGGYASYTIRNDTGGGIRFLTSSGAGYSSYASSPGGGTYINAISQQANTTAAGGAGWNGQGFTLFCNTSTPSNTTPALALGCSNTGSGTNYITSLQPGVQWTPLQISAGTIAFYLNGVVVGYTVASGGSNVSDEREKLDINDLKTSRSLERILRCKPKYYKRKYYDFDAEGNPTTPAPQSAKDAICIGLLAQDVLGHNPHCISTWENENVKKTDCDDGTRFGVNYQDFTIHLIGAVQEQQKQIDTLTERSQTFEAHARDLEEKLAAATAATETLRRESEARFNKLAEIVSALAGK